MLLLFPSACLLAYLLDNDVVVDARVFSKYYWHDLFEVALLEVLVKLLHIKF